MQGERILRGVDFAITRAESALGVVFPHSLNPITQSGAIASVSFLAATVTGIVLLVWYSSSVHQAWPSVEAMAASPWTAGLVRSLHRYTSDACMAFALLHALRLFAARRFTGARWLAWITGIASVGILWFVGWLGYWLIWDTRAQAIALGTAKMLDILPIFADPFSRGFLTDESVNSLLFFVVFFLHMLIPLVMAVVLWLHVARVARPGFLTGKSLSIALAAAFVAMSLAWPATSSPRANMLSPASAATLDHWYLAPIMLTDRVGGAGLWAILVGGAIALFPIPWLVTRGRARVAHVEVSRCNACRQCFSDCPYNAIQMIPRTDGKDLPEQAHVIASRCVGCGICAGSCDSNGVGLPWFDVQEQRRRIESWLQLSTASGEAPILAVVGADSAGGDLRVDPETGRCDELPGYVVLMAPCAGWVHAMTIERALKRGARSVLIVSCPEGMCRYREGAKWTRLRHTGERKPAFREERADVSAIRRVEFAPGERSKLFAVAEAYRGDTPNAPRRALPALVRHSVAAIVAVVLSATIVVGSDAPYPNPPVHEAQLIVSFKHPGHVSEDCRTLSEAEKLELPPHMRRDRICERRRSPVRLRIEIDNEPAREFSYEPRGIWGDGNSVAVERTAISPGEHRVAVAIGETPDGNEWTWREERTVRVEGSD
ncbi:MAG: cytochrome b N-terminal domain-containing protein, partial [Deltaproteobacteria bacterium]|nr:cytochrome b N-terminal domain-containing protein [Deltaproteobacteria bacterium]